MTLVRLPMLLPPQVTTHTEGLLAEVLARAPEQEADQGVVQVGIWPAQPWLDTDDVASAVVMVTNATVENAESHANDIAACW